MRKAILLIIAAIFSIVSCKDSRKSQEKEVETPFFTLTNSIDVDREEVVVLTKDQILERLPEFDESQLLSFQDENSKKVPYQLDDLDLDGTWDEVSMVVSFNGKESKKVYAFAKAETQKKSFKKYTDVHMGVGEKKPVASEVQKYVRTSVDPRDMKDSLFLQMEGPAWENDKVGFRMYFDKRNGIDIFGKTTAEPTLYKQGLETSYHEQADWGMDILKVGNSLGAGSIAVEVNDSLYRLKGVNGARFETITEGPARAIFKMTYLDEYIDGKPINVIHTISIEKGDWFYKSDVRLSGKTGGMELVTGIVDLKPNEVYNQNVSADGHIYYSYGKQSENDDQLGMAVITPHSDVSVYEAPTEGKGIIQTHLLKFNNKARNTFYFMSGWEASDERFRTQSGFETVLKEEARKITHPIIIE
ncbi:MAG: DUF4861 domain-containing protein [Nonlabens sp.]